MKSFSSKVGAILAPTTVYGFAIKNLTNKTIHHTNTKNDNISNKSNTISRNFLFFNNIIDILIRIKPKNEKIQQIHPFIFNFYLYKA